VQVPTEVAWPGQDPLFPFDWSDRLGEWYADARLTKAPEAGHFVPLEAPDLMAAALIRLLEPPEILVDATGWRDAPAHEIGRRRHHRQSMSTLGPIYRLGAGVELSAPTTLTTPPLQAFTSRTGGRAAGRNIGCIKDARDSR
jgi:hypothetical protein